MPILLSHTTALEFWYSPRSHHLAPRPSRLVQPAAKDASEKGVLALLDSAGLGNLTRPVHLLLPDAASRFRGREIAAHLQSTPLPKGSIFRISKDVLVCAPEPVFVQIAKDYSALDAFRLGTEMCGHYATNIPADNHTDQGFGKHAPITSTSALESYVERAAGLHGVDRARKALPFVFDRSRSPMETMLALMCALPLAKGGRHTVKPELNVTIELPKRTASIVGLDHLAPDLLWSDLQVALEYDSAAYHSKAEQKSRDTLRRLILETTGISVYSISPQCVLDLAKFNATIDLLDKSAHLLSTRERPRGYDFASRQRDLQAALLVNPAHDPKCFDREMFEKSYFDPSWIH